MLNQRAVPFCYLWSPHLIPRPDDWKPHVDVADFVFLEQQGSWEPPPELVRFLEAGDPPVYVGFGSCVVEDPEGLTRTVFEALERAGARGIVSAGWGGLGGGEVPPHVLLIGESAHDWLFPRCAAVCHHGGAGTTAMGLRCGRPTVVVPFFGDQPFWGRMIAEAGAGAEPVPIGELDAERLAEAFRTCARPEVRARAEEIGETLRRRNGADLAVEAFYRQLPTTADGLIGYLGFHAGERQRLLEGEIVSAELPEDDAGRLGVSVAVRIGVWLPDLLEQLRTDRVFEVDPHVLDFGRIEDREPTIDDFRGVGFGPDEWGEVQAYLETGPGDALNFSDPEIERFARLRADLGAGRDRLAATEGVEQTLREVLLERLRAYRADGLRGIAPYARPDGVHSDPAGELRVLGEDNALARAQPDLYRAFLDYPASPCPDTEQRFYWVRRRIGTRAAFLLAHVLLYSSEERGIFVVRHFYVSAAYEALQFVMGCLPHDHDCLLVGSQRLATHRNDLALRLADPTRHPAFGPPGPWAGGGLPHRRQLTPSGVYSHQGGSNAKSPS